MLRLSALFGIILVFLTACDEAVVSSGPSEADEPARRSTSEAWNAKQAARAFVNVANRMEPVMERECRARTRNVSCDFKILVDDRPNQQPNAFQTLDSTGRPLIVFNAGLIRMARNEDEIAFVMGHEGAHHIEGHIPKQRDNAIAGAVIFAGLATLSGGDASSVRSAQELGAQVGARTYSKEFELEADELGTILTIKSGYNALRGAEFFNRIPDPGDKFLGTHPPNAQRKAIVRKTAARF